MTLEDLIHTLKEKTKRAKIKLPWYLYLTKKFIGESNEVAQFYLKTNPFQREKMEHSLDTFSSDLLDYLKTINPAGFKPIHPTPSQLNNLHLILESAETETLIHDCTKKYARNKNIGILKRYSSPIHDTQEQRTVSYVVHWNFNHNQPSLCTLSGKNGHDFQMIALFFSPHKITTPEQTKGTSFDSFYSGLDVKTRVYDHGKRIDNLLQINYKGEIIEQKDTCYYIGRFQSLTTGQEHHVYAKNNNDRNETRYLPIQSKQLQLAHESA